MQRVVLAISATVKPVLNAFLICFIVNSVYAVRPAPPPAPPPLCCRGRHAFPRKIDRPRQN
jgi:hypothetical protein